MLFTTVDYINIFLAFFTLFPIYVLLQQFLITRISDYLIFALVFISSFFSFSMNVVAHYGDLLILYQIHHFALSCIYFFLFLHVLRVRENNINSILKYLGYLWFIIIVGFIISWDLMQQPKMASTIFGFVRRSTIEYSPNGAGIAINGVIIYSTGFRMFADLYYLFVTALMFYTYYKIEPVHNTQSIKKARTFWLIASGFILVFWIISNPYLFPINELKVMALIGLLFMTYIALRIPEGMLITHAQLMRAIPLYKRIQQIDDSVNVELLGLDKVIKFIKSMPKDLKEDLKIK